MSVESEFDWGSTAHQPVTGSRLGINKEIKSWGSARDPTPPQTSLDPATFEHLVNKLAQHGHANIFAKNALRNHQLQMHQQQQAPVQAVASAAPSSAATLEKKPSSMDPGNALIKSYLATINETTGNVRFFTHLRPTKPSGDETRPRPSSRTEMTAN